MKRLTYCIVAAALALPSGILAETKRTLEDCHIMNTGYIRLMCYDEVSGFKAEKAPEPTTSKQVTKPSGNQWSVSTEKSALTGRTDVFMSIASENREPNSIGTPEAGRLWIRCMDNTTALLIMHGIYVSDAHNVRYKLDDGPIQKKWMRTLRGGDGVGLFSGRASIPFIKSMFDKDKMVAVISGYSRNVELEFDISGLRDRIDELATSCEWKP